MKEETDDHQALAKIHKAQSIEAFAAILDDLEIPTKERTGILRRLGRKIGEKQPPGQIDTKWLLSQLDEKLALALSYLDEFSLARANARDIGTIISQLIDRRQLLKGEPTQIVTHEDRRKLNELIPLMMKEAERRGVVVDLSSEDYEEIGQSPVIPVQKPEKKSLLRRKPSAD